MPKPKSRTPVLATKHKDKRANIPTEELRDFVADDEKAPRKILYPLDPSLDPQLVWQGKDEQDASPLEVPAVPIYIQEKIHPQVIIENLRAGARTAESARSSEQGHADSAVRAPRQDNSPSSPTSTASSSSSSLNFTCTRTA